MRRLILSASGAVLAAACSKDAPPPGVSAAPVPAAAGSVASASAPAAPGSTVASAMVANNAGWVPARPPPLPPSTKGPPPGGNVILLSIDSLRADMPWNGYARPIAPRLTELEAKAVSFRNAYSVSSYTSMSLGGLLGGRMPSELVRDGYFFGIYKKDLFFPKLLQRDGVHTMGVMAHMYFKGAGFDSGFDDWRIVPGITFDANTDRDITSPQHEKIAEEMLGDPANDSRPFFFWAHFLDPHDLYQLHDGINWGNNPRDRYDGEVTFTDRYIGKLLDFIADKPWAQRTTIIVTADHGEEFGEHGMTRHGFEVWNTLVHVPLMILAPGAAPRRVDVLRSGIDLAPTILELLGVTADPSFEGTSLVSEVYGGPTPERDVVVDLPMTSDSGRRRALVHGTEKLICVDTDSACKLYDLAVDPMERAAIVRGDRYADMKGRYDAVVKNIKEVAPYGCGADCLNTAYRKKQQPPDGAQ
jgi:choline-sulfatase